MKQSITSYTYYVFPHFEVPRFQSSQTSKLQNFRVAKIQSFECLNSRTKFQTFKKLCTRMSQHFQYFEFPDLQNLVLNMHCFFLSHLNTSAINKGVKSRNLVTFLQNPDMLCWRRGGILSNFQKQFKC